MRSAGSAKDKVRPPSSSNLQCDEEQGSRGSPEVTPVFKFHFPVGAPDQGAGLGKEVVVGIPTKYEVSSVELKDL